MTTENSGTQEAPNKSILGYIWDLPNLCSLAGLCCTIFALYFIAIGVYAAAMIGMIWAVAFDWADGLIARRLKGRTGTDSKFGGQLDLLIDVVSYAVTPAMLLLSYGKFDPAFLPGAILILIAGVMRLSYFSTFGLADGTKYTGLAIDNNSIILVFVFLFENWFNPGTFSIILYISALTLAALNVSKIQTPKLSGNPVNVVLLAVYTLTMSVLYGWTLI
ncbi:MAG: CDP-alcohol phosphatidyltransferase family protein [Cohaesibacteraceae bacterium]|nr:CDP-alcohol phosphatidyltransferase family protein [Cohaesibacteraceae bacterium]